MRILLISFIFSAVLMVVCAMPLNPPSSPLESTPSSSQDAPSFVEARSRTSAMLQMISGVQFSSFEHEHLGKAAIDDARKKIAAAKLGRTDPEKLALGGGVTVEFGTIVFVWGDFIGPSDPAKPFCKMNDKDVRTAFEAVMNKFPKSMVDCLKTVRTRQIALVKKATDAGKNPKDYSADGIGQQFDQDYVLCSLGKPPLLDKPRSSASYYMDVVVNPSPFMKLAQSNYDHFASEGCARDAYRVFHRLAHTLRKEGKIDLALAAEAASLHYISDMFAGGHTRTERKRLADSCAIRQAGHGLAKCQHDEDGALAVPVTNGNKVKWDAYGDDSYFDKKHTSQQLVVDAMSASIQEIFLDTPPAETALKAYAPIATDDTNAAPMFRYVNGDMYLRDPFPTTERIPLSKAKYNIKLKDDPTGCLALFVTCLKLNPRLAPFLDAVMEKELMARKIGLDVLRDVKVMYGQSTDAIDKLIAQIGKETDGFLSEMKKKMSTLFSGASNAWDQAKAAFKKRFGI